MRATLPIFHLVAEATTPSPKRYARIRPDLHDGIVADAFRHECKLL
jgi:hypothetical protein